MCRLLGMKLVLILAVYLTQDNRGPYTLFLSLLNYYFTIMFFFSFIWWHKESGRSLDLGWEWESVFIRSWVGEALSYSCVYECERGLHEGSIHVPHVKILVYVFFTPLNIGRNYMCDYFVFNSIYDLWKLIFYFVGKSIWVGWVQCLSWVECLLWMLLIFWYFIFSILINKKDNFILVL